MPRKKTGRTCIIDDCRQELYAKGQCNMHYKRFRKYGSFDDPKLTFEQRFWRNVDKSSECWLWTARTNENGYGVTSLGTSALYAHRASYAMAYGPIPDGLYIDHRCHKPACVNPSHLRVVDNKRNMENMLGAKCTSKSGVRGVYRRDYGRWQVQVTHNRKVHNGGTFVELADAEAAAIALRNKLFTHNDADRVL